MILPNKSAMVPIRQISLSSRVLLSKVFFPSFSNAAIIFETVLLATPNNSAVFATLAPAIRAQTTCLLLKSDRIKSEGIITLI